MREGASYALGDKFLHCFLVGEAKEVCYLKTLLHYAKMM
jgi:hypothetical protein